MTNDAYVAWHLGFVEVHSLLRTRLVAVRDGAPARALETLGPDVLGLGGFLRGHHRMEDEILFRMLRTHGRLRSTDAACLDARAREHREVDRLCEQLVCAAMTSDGRPALHAIATELEALLGPHFAAEETTLGPDRLREMLSPTSMEELGEQIRASRR
jgi:hypothetical protein